MIYHKKLITIMLTAFLPVMANAERVFTDKELKAWGYQTAEIGKIHEIRSMKNYGDSKIAFYARFILRKVTYKSAAEAIATMNRIELKRKSTVLDRDKNYEQALRKGRDLYYIRATSNYTYLQHQPSLMKKVKQHLQDKN